MVLLSRFKMADAFYEIGYRHASTDNDFQDWLKRNELFDLSWKKEVLLWHDWIEPYQYNDAFQEWYEKMFNWMGPELASSVLEDKQSLYANWLALDVRTRENSLWRVSL